MSRAEERPDDRLLQRPSSTRPLQPWDVSIVASQTGSIVHLIENRDLHNSPGPRALCGIQANAPTSVWFALNGCKRCCRAAVKAGLESVVDVDAELIALSDVLVRPY